MPIDFQILKYTLKGTRSLAFGIPTQIMGNWLNELLLLTHGIQIKLFITEKNIVFHH